jgi:hypothetical protein
MGLWDGAAAVPAAALPPQCSGDEGRRGAAPRVNPPATPASRGFPDAAQAAWPRGDGVLPGHWSCL